MLISRSQSWEIYQHGYEYPTLINSNPQYKLISSKWLSTDSNIFFTLSSNIVNIWNTSTSSILLHLDLESGNILEPSFFSNDLLIIGEQDKFSVKSYYNLHNIAILPEKIKQAKWSPYREEYFATAGYNNKVKIWDIRKLSSPIYVCGYPIVNYCSKKRKYENSTNIYQDSFMISNSDRALDEAALALEFSEDGRFLFIQTAIDILLIDLLYASNTPRRIAKGKFTKKKTDIATSITWTFC